MRRRAPDAPSDGAYLDRLATSALNGERVDVKALARAAKGFVEEQSAGRLPPHDLDAEAAVLSACILDREALDRVIELLKGEHFYSDANRLIYDAIATLALGGAPVDIVTVRAHLITQNTLQKAGGSAYLAQIVDATPAIANVFAHAALIYELYRRRSMIALAHTIANEGYRDPAAALEAARVEPGEQVEQTWLEHCATRVQALTSAVTVAPVVMISHSITKAMRTVENVEGRRGEVLGYTTGIAGLDRELGGLMPSDVTLIGAKKTTDGQVTTTSAGKSAFISSVAVHLASTGYRFLKEENGAQVEVHEKIGVVIFGMEMTHEQYAMRMICNCARVDGALLRQGGYIDPTTGRLYPDIAERLQQASDFLKTLPIVFETEGGISPSRLRARIVAVRNELATKHGARLGMVMIDSVGLMATARALRDDNREKELNRIGRSLRLLSTDKRLPGIHYMAVTQIQPDGRPKDCPSLADHAVNQLTLELDDDTEETVIPGIIRIRKQRDGRHGVRVPIWFHKTHGAFSDYRKEG